MRLSLPRTTSPFFSLDKPFTSRQLPAIRELLASSYSEENESSALERTAAVLIPLCNVGDRPGVLFELRGKLRHHPGEVSFPGGKVDQTDPTTLFTAIRETNEELGVLLNQIEILGRIGPSTISLSGLRVYPYVGFIHQETDTVATEPTNDTPLPNLSMSRLTPSPAEVLHAFHRSFSDLTDPQLLRQHEFRGGTPYWAVDVTSSVEDTGLEWQQASGMDEVGGSGVSGKLEIWGLTGWYLNAFMRLLKLYD